MASMVAQLISQPRRRFLRLSVRSLIILVLIIGAWFGWLVRSARLQREAVTAIEKSGGTAHYNWTFNDGAFIEEGKPWAPSRLIDLFGIDHFGHVTYVRLRTTTDDLLAHVASLDRVQHLSISDESEINAGLAHLSGLTELTELTLRSAPVSDAGLAHLKRLTRLSKLEILRGTQVTDAGLTYLKGMTKLSELLLFETQITGPGLENLKGMTKLRRLNLGQAPITDAGLAQLKNLTSLEDLKKLASPVKESMSSRKPYPSSSSCKLPPPRGKVATMAGATSVIKASPGEVTTYE